MSFRSVELLDIQSRSSCQLEDLPDKRFGHSMNNKLICGGNLDVIGVSSGSDYSDCLELDQGKYDKYWCIWNLKIMCRVQTR